MVLVVGTCVPYFLSLFLMSSCLLCRCHFRVLLSPRASSAPVPFLLCPHRAVCVCCLVVFHRLPPHPLCSHARLALSVSPFLARSDATCFACRLSLSPTVSPCMIAVCTL